MHKKFEKLPQLMKDAIEVLQELHNSPDELVMPAVLGVANLATNPHYKLDTRLFGEIPISLYLLAILPTGMRKSTNFREIMIGIDRFQEQKRIKLKDEDLRYKLEKRLFDKECIEYEKKKLDPKTLVEPTVPKKPRPIEKCQYTIGKATVNGIIDRLKNQSFVGLFSSEAGEFFNSHSFQGGKNDISKAIEMSAALTSMWDGSPIDKQTGMESVRLTGRAVNMLFMLQEETVRDVLNNPVFSAQGFIHRILISQIGQQKNIEIELTPEALAKKEQIKKKLEKFHDRIFKIISMPLVIKDDNQFELEKRTLTYDEHAAKVFQDFYNINRNRGTDDLKSYEGFAQRLLEHCFRIAGTVAAFENKDVIEKRDAECAVDLMDYFIDQRQCLELGVRSMNEHHVQACNKLRDWMVKKQFRGTENELRKNVRWFKDLSNDERERVLSDLVLDGFVSVEILTSRNNKEISVFSAEGTKVKGDKETF